MKDRNWLWKRVCVCACVRERERECVRVCACVRERECVCACVQGVRDGQLQSSLDPALLQVAHYRRVSSPQYIMFRKELLFHSHENFFLPLFRFLLQLLRQLMSNRIVFFILNIFYLYFNL